MNNPSPVDPAEALGRYAQFIADISSLTNATDLAFFEMTLGQLLNIDLSAFDSTDDLLAILSAAGGIDIEGTAAISFSTTEEVLGFVYESLKATVAGLGTIYQDDATNAQLTLINAVMTALAARLQQSTPGGCLIV